MNYIYDIYLNLQKNLYDFYDWDKKDKLLRIKKIPIFKVEEDILKKLISYKIKLDDEIYNLIYKKAEIWDLNNKQSTIALFTDKNSIVAIEFNNKKESINKSYLMIEEELDILDTLSKLKEKDIIFKCIQKENIYLKTRKEINKENFIDIQLKNIDNNKLNYIFFECFGKKNISKRNMINKIKNMKKNSKEYENLYNILKLTSKTK